MPASDGIAVAVVGVTGYEGAGVARLVARHPALRLTEIISRSAVGTSLGTALPAFASSPCADLPITESVQHAELVIVSVPHGIAAPLIAQYHREGRRVIDISADFRLADPALYAHWYGHPHTHPELLPEAVYGLTEVQRERIRTSSIVANPGCFPTGAILAVRPAILHDLVEGDVIVDAKTGVSGAGRSPSRRVHYVEVDDSLTAYGLNGHRHLPEIEVTLADARPEAPPAVTFVPHLAPMKRGILSTCYLRTRPGVTEVALRENYRAHYADDPFVTIIDTPPETGWVYGSNQCLISIHVDERRQRAIIISAIDNLMKGGAGQAIQNANVMYDLAETTGIDREGVWP